MSRYFASPNFIDEQLDCGWYVSTYPFIEGGGYLHTDGKCYARTLNDKGEYTGFFETEELAWKAIMNYYEE